MCVCLYEERAKARHTALCLQARSVRGTQTPPMPAYCPPTNSRQAVGQPPLAPSQQHQKTNSAWHKLQSCLPAPRVRGGRYALHALHAAPGSPSRRNSLLGLSGGGAAATVAGGARGLLPGLDQHKKVAGLAGVCSRGGEGGGWGERAGELGWTRAHGVVRSTHAAEQVAGHLGARARGTARPWPLCRAPRLRRSAHPCSSFLLCSPPLMTYTCCTVPLHCAFTLVSIFIALITTRACR